MKTEVPARLGAPESLPPLGAPITLRQARALRSRKPWDLRHERDRAQGTSLGSDAHPDAVLSRKPVRLWTDRDTAVVRIRESTCEAGAARNTLEAKLVVQSTTVQNDVRHRDHCTQVGVHYAPELVRHIPALPAIDLKLKF